MPLPYSLDFSRLSRAYDAHSLTPRAVVSDIVAEIESTRSKNPAWIHVFAQDTLLARADDLERRRSQGETLPLYGIPFAVKDNIDIAGQPTTAACPAYRYLARETAFAVQRLEDSGAICIGKTNMDQFATGLVGTRSPHGACLNPFNDRYISGGSSSGSAVAVALGHVSFALGTDTAGSGRVPAGFCNVVGVKPTHGFLSTRGIVPACRSLDCVSIFALNVVDATRVREVAAEYDGDDPYSRRAGICSDAGMTRLRCGVPRTSDLKFFDDAQARKAFDRARAQLERIGAELIEIDYSSFADTGRLLYEGPWVAERLAAIEPFFKASSAEINPVVRDIIAGGARYSAVDACNAQYRLRALERASAAQWSLMDMLMVPTAGTIYRIDEIAADPVHLNSNLGYYTNFANLLDLSAIAVPAGFRDDGLPFGVTFIAQAFEDARLAQWGERFHQATSRQLGATRYTLELAAGRSSESNHGCVTLAVVGAHLSGMPLNHQLTSRGARLIEATETAAEYRLYALANSTPPKPGLARVNDGRGCAIAVEVWSIPQEAFGSFVAEVPPPLAIGTVKLASGTAVKGFVCEAYALGAARDISEFGGWRNFRMAAG
ncbi:MAG: allophanate hydrolase [Pseudomonadota bacterium]